MLFATKSLLACSAVIALGRVAAWPIKTIDESNNGQNCDESKEQYLQVEAYDYHDHPKITMRWRQLTGECGGPADNPMSWEETYDSSAGDKPATADDGGRVQLNIFVCAPFGEYEIELVIESYSDDGSTLQQRTAWEIENGPDEYHIWDTVNTNLKDMEEYSPTVPGTYVWPLENETGYYSTIYAGLLPPKQCPSSEPTGTVYAGCFKDSKSSRLFKSDYLERREIGKDGMTTHMCSTHCADYEYFGVEYGSECYCGTADEYESATALEPTDSGYCGTEYRFLCTGDATTACGGRNAIGVYHRTGVTPPYPPTPAPITPPGSSYTSEGCYIDSKHNRIMSREPSSAPMSAKVCFDLCTKDASNTHFGTQYGVECWCGVGSNLNANGKEVDSHQCDYDCSGASGEKCGGYNRMSAYTIGGGDYKGCYKDRKSGRVMGHKITDTSMTNEVCRAHCADVGTTYFGTQYGKECWCGETYDRHGPDEHACDYPCAGDAHEICGGYNALSVYYVH